MEKRSGRVLSWIKIINKMTEMRMKENLLELEFHIEQVTGFVSHPLLNQFPLLSHTKG